MNVVNIIKDLNSFIIHRDMGPLAYMKYTHLIDSNYGLVKSGKIIIILIFFIFHHISLIIFPLIIENFWNKYLFFIVLFIVVILLVTLLCFIEQRRNPKV
jgi:hypothetical protein